jgi:hypothetical protein
VQVSDENALRDAAADIDAVASRIWTGATGTFRALTGSTRWSASNDLLRRYRGWFQKDPGPVTPYTQEAYQRAIERLILWAVHERKKALCRPWTEADFFAFKEFLTDPPEHWVQAVAKGTPKQK